MALMLALATDALAQTTAPRPTVALAEDMRLWSFGDCDRRFPYVDTNEHQECVRAVGSPEARDARALRVCEMSHPSDREEARRCMDTYQSNKEKAARNFAAVAPEVLLGPPTPEVMRRVKAITSAAVEERQAGAPAAARPVNAQSQAATASNAEEASSSLPTIVFVLLAVILAGIGATVVRKRQAQSA